MWVQLSGTLPACLSSLSSLTTLITHRNQFRGNFPPLDHLNGLTSLTLFENTFGGVLRLPSAANFTLLLGQANRLSCGLSESSDTIADSRRALVLPGDTFSAPITTLGSDA